MTIHKALDKDARCIARYTEVIGARLPLSYVRENLCTTWVALNNDGAIIGYLLCHVPGALECGRAMECGLPLAEWSRVVHLVSASVLLEYRGDRILCSLIRQMMTELSHRGYCHYLVDTKSTDKAAIKSLLLEGFHTYTITPQKWSFHCEYGKEASVE